MGTQTIELSLPREHGGLLLLLLLETAADAALRRDAAHSGCGSHWREQTGHTRVAMQRDVEVCGRSAGGHIMQ